LAQKAAVEQQAWMVAGVKSVDASELEIEWSPSAGKKRPFPTNISDFELKEAVTRRLLGNPRVAPYRIKVITENGMVYLSGTVGNLLAKHAAHQEAQDTQGAWWIKNRIRIRPPLERSDADITVVIRSALLRDPYLNRLEIVVRVLDNKAYLSGEAYIPGI
jgi:osmotically-inducible protein OsmY